MALFPLAIILGMLQIVPVLAPLVGPAAALAFILLGYDLWQKARASRLAARSAGEGRGA